MNVNSFNIVTLNLGKRTLNKVRTFSNVYSPYARIYYVVSGTAIVEMQGKQYTLCPKNFYLIPPFVKFSITFLGKFVHYYLHAYEDNISGKGIFETYDLPFEIEAQNGDKRLFERLTKLNPHLKFSFSGPKDYDNKEQFAPTDTPDEQCPDWVTIETHGILLQLYARFLAKAEAKLAVSDERIDHAIRYIRNHLNETITLQQLADEVELASAYFVRLFRRTTGMSPKSYVNMKRIEKAQYLLHTTNLTVKEIACCLGYPDDSYFVRAFRRITSMSPLMYRKCFAQQGHMDKQR